MEEAINTFITGILGGIVGGLCFFFYATYYINKNIFSYGVIKKHKKDIGKLEQIEKEVQQIISDIHYLKIDLYDLSVRDIKHSKNNHPISS